MIKVKVNTSGASHTDALRAEDGFKWALLDPRTLDVILVGQGMCALGDEQLREAKIAAAEFIARSTAKAAEQVQHEAAKITLRVRNVGKGRNFGRATEYARAHGGEFDGAMRTWTVRIAPEDRADLERLHGLQEIEVVALGAPAPATHTLEALEVEISEQPVARLSDAEIIAAVEARTVHINNGMRRHVLRGVRAWYSALPVSRIPQAELGEIVQDAWERAAHRE